MKNILLVCGGDSYEHDISVVTATQIFSKTKLSDVNLIFLYISRDNKFFVYTGKKIELKDFSVTNFTASSKKFKEIVFVSSEKNRLFTKSLLGLKEYAKADVALLCTHGGAGENGKLVSFFESLGIMTTSGNFDSLAVCMNKFLFKQVMKGLKLPTVKGFRIKKAELKNKEDLIKFKLRVIKYPVVIKPVNGGSSIGLFIARNDEEFFKNLNDALQFDNEVLVERFIEKTREFNIAVMGLEENVVVSEVDEPLKNNEVLTFADKYMKGGNSKKMSGSKGSMESQNRRFPADISDDLRKQMQSMARKIFENLNLVGVVRIDFLYSEKLNKLYVCEVNAIPGSLSYYFFCRSGYLINDFVNKLIDIAENKNKYKPVINKDFMPSILE